MIQIKRTYEPPASADGKRILVERLWPRGMTKEAVRADAWLKEVAPSTELRKWFDHQLDRWEEFQRRYRAELDANSNAWDPLLSASSEGMVTLLYSAHDPLHNGALVLRDYLAERVAHQPHRKVRDRAQHESATGKKKSTATGSGRRSARRKAG